MQMYLIHVGIGGVEGCMDGDNDPVWNDGCLLVKGVACNRTMG